MERYFLGGRTRLTGGEQKEGEFSLRGLVEKRDSLAGGLRGKSRETRKGFQEKRISKGHPKGGKEGGTRLSGVANCEREKLFGC